MDGLKSDIIGLVALDKVKSEMDSLIDRARQLKRIHNEFGIPQDKLQAQEYALRAQGKTLDDLDRLYEKLNKARKEAISNPTGDQARVFDAIMGAGFSASGQLQNYATSDLFNAMTYSLSQMGEKAAPYFAEIFGKGSEEMMDRLGESFQELQDDFAKTGRILNDDTIENLASFGRQVRLAKLELELMAGRAIQWFADRASEVGVIASDTGLSKGAWKRISETKSLKGLWEQVWQELGTASVEVDRQKQQDAAERASKESLRRAEEEQKYREFMGKFMKSEPLKEEKIKEEKQRKEIEAARRVNSLTSLQQIGAYAGDSTNAMILTLMQQQNNELSALRKEVSKIAQDTRMFVA